MFRAPVLLIEFEPVLVFETIPAPVATLVASLLVMLAVEPAPRADTSMPSELALMVPPVLPTTTAVPAPLLTAEMPSSPAPVTFAAVQTLTEPLPRASMPSSLPVTAPLIREPAPAPMLIVPVSAVAWMPSSVRPVMVEPLVSLTFTEPAPPVLTARTPTA